MMMQVGKITLLSNDKGNGTQHSVCDYTFNRMDKNEQDSYLHLSLGVNVASQMGGVGSKMLKELTDLTSEMEIKYNAQKPETLFQMKARLLKQGFK